MVSGGTSERILLLRVLADVDTASQSLQGLQAQMAQTSTQAEKLQTTSTSTSSSLTKVGESGTVAASGLGDLQARAVETVAGMLGIEGGGKAVTQVLTDLAPEATAAAAALVAVGAAAQVFSDWQSKTSAVLSMSEAFGITQSQAAGLQATFEDVGKGADGANTLLMRMSVGLKTAQDQMANGKDASGPFIDGLNALGISATKTDGSVKSVGDLLPDIFDKFKQLHDAGQTGADGLSLSTIAADLFGRAGAANIVVLEQLGKSYAENSAEQERMGIWTQDNVDKFVKWNVASTDLHDQLTKVEVELGGAMAPALTTVANVLSTVIDHGTALTNVMKAASGPIGQIEGIFSSVVVVGHLLSDELGLLEAGWNKLPGPLKSVVESMLGVNDAQAKNTESQKTNQAAIEGNIGAQAKQKLEADAAATAITRAAEAQSTGVKQAAQDQATEVKRQAEAQEQVASRAAQQQETEVTRSAQDQATAVKRAAEDQATAVTRSADAAATAVTRLADAQATAVTRSADQQATAVTRSAEAQAEGVKRATDAYVTDITRQAEQLETDVSRAAESQATNVTRAAEQQASDVTRQAEQQATDVTRAAEQQATDVSRAADEQATNVARSADEQATAVKRSADDQNTGTTRAAQDQETGIKRSAQDQATEIRNQAEAQATAVTRAAQGQSREAQAAAADQATRIRQHAAQQATDVTRSADDQATAVGRAADDQKTTTTRSADDQTTAIKHAATDQTTAIRQAAQDQETIIRQSAQDNATSIRQGGADAVTAIKQNAQDEATAIKQAGQDQITAIKQALADQVTAIRATEQDKTKAITQGAQDEATAIKQSAQDQTTIIKQAGQDQVTTIKQNAADQVTEVKRGADDTVTVLNQLSDDEKTAIKQAADDAITVMKQNTDDQLTEMSRRAEAETKMITQAAEDQAKAVRDGTAPIPAQFEHAYEDARQRVEASLEHQQRSVTSSLQDTSVKAQVGSFAIGQAIDGGVVSGITSGQPLVNATAANMGTQALKAAAEAILAHSPSQAAADQIGMPIALGVVKGITAGQPAVNTALANSVYAPMSNVEQPTTLGQQAGQAFSGAVAAGISSGTGQVMSAINALWNAVSAPGGTGMFLSGGGSSGSSGGGGGSSSGSAGQSSSIGSFSASGGGGGSGIGVGMSTASIIAAGGLGGISGGYGSDMPGGQIIETINNFQIPFQVGGMNYGAAQLAGMPWAEVLALEAAAGTTPTTTGSLTLAQFSDIQQQFQKAAMASPAGSASGSTQTQQQMQAAAADVVTGLTQQKQSITESVAAMTLLNNIENSTAAAIQGNAPLQATYASALSALNSEFANETLMINGSKAGWSEFEQSITLLSNAAKTQAFYMKNDPFVNMSQYAQDVAAGLLGASKMNQINGVPGFAGGGTISSPQILIDASTGQVTGTMAESGPEAIVPLSGNGAASLGSFRGSGAATATAAQVVNLYLTVQGGVYGDMGAAAGQLGQAIIAQLLPLLKTR